MDQSNKFWLLIYAPEFKWQHFEVDHVCVGKPYMYICSDLHVYWDISMHLQRFMPMHYISGYAHAKPDNLYSICSNC